MQANGHIAALNREWNNRNIEQQAYLLQQAAGKNDMKPLRNFQKNLKKPQHHTKNISLYNEDRTETHDKTQTLKRWTQWIQTRFRKQKKKTRTYR